MPDMESFEKAIAIADDERQIARHAIRLMQLATDMFGAICDNADETPDEVLYAAERWYLYLTEVATP